MLHIPYVIVVVFVILVTSAVYVWWDIVSLKPLTQTQRDSRGDTGWDLVKRHNSQIPVSYWDVVSYVEH